MRKENISVCIPTYNGELYIRQQLDSILCQLSENDEIIISDDSSDDKTIDIIKSYKDDRIFLIEHCTYKNPIYNLENALNHAKGELIFLSDQDDIWMPEKVSIMCNHLLNNDLVLHDCIITNTDLSVKEISFFKFNNSKKGLLPNLRKNSYIGCCMAFKSSILKKVLPFPKDIPLHDLWIGFVSELFFKSIFIDEKLLLYRRHSNNQSFTGEKSNYTIFRKFMFRFNCIKYIPKLIFR